MIISCNNCNKKFNIDSSLIPEKGRLLQCNSCNHKWFFKKEIINESILSVKTDKTIEKIEPIKKKLEHQIIEKLKDIELLDKQPKDEYLSNSPSISENKNNNLDIDLKKESKKNYNILGLTIVFIISFIALIVVLDTFQNLISKIVPNIEFLLYSLYETINDVKLFLKDLI